MTNSVIIPEEVGIKIAQAWKKQQIKYTRKEATSNSARDCIMDLLYVPDFANREIPKPKEKTLD